MQPIYLDHNATTPLAPEAARAMVECQEHGWANAASQHTAGRAARRLLENAREGIARLLGADPEARQPDRLIFTSGGTEANNLAILGLVAIDGSGTRQSSGDQGTHLRTAPPHVIISAIEHPSVAGPAEHLKRRGWRVDLLPVSPQGAGNCRDLERLLTPQTRLVSVMLGNNETGALQPVRELAALCRAAGVPFHTDAVQAAGKLPLDFRDLGAAAMTVSAHKFHGPRGIGALIVRHDVALGPLLHGGFQQEGLRPGTEPVPLAVGMHAALTAWAEEREGRAARLARLRGKFEADLKAACPEIIINGAGVPRLPHTSNVAFPGLDRQALLIALDLAGVACSTGSACASGSSEPSPVLKAMGVPPEVLASSLRFSLGATTSEVDVEEAVRRIARVCDELRGTTHRRAAAASTAI